MRWIILILSISVLLEVQASDEAGNTDTNRRGVTDRRPEIYWQDTFYTVHRNGPQHILVYLADENKFDEMLAPIVKLLGENSTCSIRIVTPEQYHKSLRRRMYISARAKLRPNQAALDTLTRELHFFRPEEWEKIIFNPSTGETKAPYSTRFSAILLDTPPGNYNWLAKLVRSINGVIYLPLVINSETLTKYYLRKAGFNQRYMRRTSQGVLCVSTSDFPLMVLPAGVLPLWHNAEDLNYLLPYDLGYRCTVCSTPSPDVLSVPEVQAKLSTETVIHSPPGSPWQVREPETMRKD